ncbi:MAG: hypothetical protein AB1603_05215 [Chloroflexota bacterium]
MKSVTQMKSLGDMRTTISTHARSTPRQKGSTFLEVYLLDKEKQRLETELGMLIKRQRRIEGRLREVRGAMDRLLVKGQQEGQAPPDLSVTPGDKGHEPRQWKRMTVGY